MATQEALFKLQEPQNQTKTHESGKGTGGDQDGGKNEGATIRIYVCTEFSAEYQPLSELSCPCPGGLRIGM